MAFPTMDTNDLGAHLARTRLAATRMKEYPCAPPGDLTEAYAVQDIMAAQMASAVVGWKIGATSQIARQRLGLNEPFSGPLFEDFTMESPAKFAVSQGDLRIVEAEIGFRMKHTLAPRSEAYLRDEVAHSIASVHPVIELINKRLPGDLKDNACWLAADGGVNHGFIYGPGRVFEPTMDMARETVEVSLDGEIVSRGIGANALGNPLDVVVWLANHLSARAIALKVDDYVSTGLIADIIVVEIGSNIMAEFENLGAVSLELV